MSEDFIICNTLPIFKHAILCSPLGAAGAGAGIGAFLLVVAKRADDEDPHGEVWIARPCTGKPVFFDAEDTPALFSAVFEATVVFSPVFSATPFASTTSDALAVVSVATGVTAVFPVTSRDGVIVFVDFSTSSPLVFTTGAEVAPAGADFGGVRSCGANDGNDGGDGDDDDDDDSEVSLAVTDVVDVRLAAEGTFTTTPPPSSSPSTTAATGSVLVKPGGSSVAGTSAVANVDDWDTVAGGAATAFGLVMASVVLEVSDDGTGTGADAPAVVGIVVSARGFVVVVVEMAGVLLSAIVFERASLMFLLLLLLLLASAVVVALGALSLWTPSLSTMGLVLLIISSPVSVLLLAVAMAVAVMGMSKPLSFEDIVGSSEMGEDGTCG